MTPEAHIASGEVVVGADSPKVSGLITAAENYSRWRKGVSKVETVRREGDVLYWRETSNGDTIDYRLDTEIPDQRLRTTILSKNLPYGGHWIIELEPHDRRTLVRITEHGVVTNVVFRGLGRLFFPHDATLKAYLRDLTAEVEGKDA